MSIGRAGIPGPLWRFAALKAKFMYRWVNNSTSTVSAIYFGLILVTLEVVDWLTDQR